MISNAAPVEYVFGPIPVTEPAVVLSTEEVLFENLGKYVAHIIVDEAVTLYGPGQRP